MIELQHLGKTFHTEDHEIIALNDINLRIEDGEIFGIIGLSGAGKSTLVRCINLLEMPTTGKVLIDGKSLTDLKRKELLKLRQNIGMIFQGFNLLEQRNVLNNVLFPLEIAGVPHKQALAKAEELIELVGLGERKTSYPSQLSGGQKQRVAIARALTTEPKYLLCDEATSALDPTTTRSILELLQQINRTMGVTVIVITHEMKVIQQICDRVAVIDQAKIAEEGLVRDVFSNPRTHIARELIIPQDRGEIVGNGGKRIRLAMDDSATGEPVVGRLILETGIPVNILFASSVNVNGSVRGQMIIELPTDGEKAGKIISWLMTNHIEFGEED